MKHFIFLLLAAVISFGAVDKAFAQGEAAVPFLLIAPDSRGGGIGETGVGLADNSTAIWWNPAGIAFLSGQEFSFTHSNWLPQFNLDDLFYDYATYRNYMPSINGSLTASIMYMSYGEFIRTSPDSPDPIGTFRSYDMAATVGYATKLSENWGFGTNFRLIHSQLSDQPTAEELGTGTATTVSFDLGFMWRPSELVIPFVDYDIGNRFSFGLNLSNLGPKITYIDQDQADPIPTNLRFGFAYQVFNDNFNSLTWTLDFSKLLVNRYEDEETGDQKSDPFYEAIITSWTDKPLDEELADVITATGLEYWYGNREADWAFAIRAGFFYEDPNYGNRKFITMGAGIRYDLYGFDFSYISTSVFKDGENHPLSDTLRFTLLVAWGQTPDNVVGLPRGM